MKKPLFALAATSVSMLPLVAQASGPIDGSVYGKINVSVVNADENGADQWQLNSNASRIGVKGKSEVREGLYAIYKAEFEMCADDGQCKGQTFSQRNIMVGIKGSLGTLWAGNHDTPTKMAQNKIDLFNDLDGDIKNAFEGENREPNVIAYTSPTFNGFSGTVAVVPGEDAEEGEDGLADGVSYLLSYSEGDLYLAVAGDKDVDAQDLMRVVGKYQIDDLTLGLMYQQNEGFEKEGENLVLVDESGYFVSAAYKIDATTLKIQYGQVEDDADGDEEETLSLGADYKLGSKTKVYAFYTVNTDSAEGESDDEDKYLAVGMEHKF